MTCWITTGFILRRRLCRILGQIPIWYRRTVYYSSTHTYVYHFNEKKCPEAIVKYNPLLSPRTPAACFHFVTVVRSRPNQIAAPGPKSGPARKSESRGPENGVSRWRRPNSDIYSQNHHFGLVYDMIYQFLGMEAKNYKFGIFANNAIHPWPQVMPIFDREMPPGFTPAICLRRNFFYISNLENRGDKSLDQNF